LEALVGNVSDFIEKSLNWWKEMMEHGWLTDIIRYMILTYFDLDELINDCNDCGGLVMTAAYPKARWKLIWKKFQLEVIDMDGVKIDKIMVKALK
jgi:putative hemolysin